MLRNIEEMMCLWTTKAVAEFVPHFFDFVFIGRKWHVWGLIWLTEGTEAQIIEKLFQIEMGIIYALRFDLLAAIQRTEFLF